MRLPERRHAPLHGAEDGLRVVERDAPRLRERRAGRRAVEQAVTELRFQLLELSAERGRREPKTLGGLAHALGLRDRVEVAEVMIVQLRQH